MRQNQDIKIQGKNVVLVPYLKEHVLQYHRWMQDPYLQEMTASQPLSEAEEFAMQQSWEQDPKKCTFIVLDKALVDGRGHPAQLQAMVGDVNLFYNDPEEASVAEIEIMIAEPAARRKGLALEALQLMMAYAAIHLITAKVRAKIGMANVASIKLFHKLGFRETSRSKVFREVTLEIVLSDRRIEIVKFP